MCTSSRGGGGGGGGGEEEALSVCRYGDRRRRCRDLGDVEMMRRSMAVGSWEGGLDAGLGLYRKGFWSRSVDILWGGSTSF